MEPFTSEEGVPSKASSEECSLEGEGSYEHESPFELEGIDPRWLEMVNATAVKAKRLGGHLAHGHFLGVQKTGNRMKVKVGFCQAIHKISLESASKTKILTDALCAFGKGAQLEVVVLADSEDLPPSLAQAQKLAKEKYQAALANHASDHPAVKRAVDEFGAQIIHVRNDL